MDHRESYLQFYYEQNQYLRRIRLIATLLVCLAMYSYLLTFLSSRKRKRGITYAPMINRDVERLKRLNRLYHGTEAHCISELRMRKSVFHRLCAELRSRALLEETFHVTIEEQMAMFIHAVGQNWSIRAIAFEFLRSTETVSRYFNLVLDALCILARDLICIRSVETHSKITSSPGRFHPYFEGCIGALDGTHIPACVPIHMQDRFRGRKSFPTQNVLAAVDFDLRFVYVLAGWEGSAHDSYILQDALARPNGLKIPEAMGKGRVMAEPFPSSRERNITWHEDQTRFLLEWCIDYKKKQHLGFKFRKPQLMLVADALNKQFAMGVTVGQVDRHFRYHKENWNFISKALRNSGNTFDHVRCLLKISESEKAALSERERRLFAKPVKWFKEMQELFSDSSATGSFARDQNTCLTDDNHVDSDDSRDLIDLNSYAHSEDQAGYDSDTLPSPTINANVESSSCNTNKKRPRAKKSPSKSTSKTKSRIAQCTDEITATVKSIREELALSSAAAPHFQMAQLADPHASLWQRLEAIPLTVDQRVLIGEHLSAKDNEGKRGWLCNASDATLNAWVFKYLCEKEGLNL